MRPIINKGEMIGEGEPIELQQELLFYVSKKNPVISAEFVYATENFPNHTAARTYDEETEEYTLRPEVHEWANLELPIFKDKLEGKDFKTKIVNGEEFWLLRAKAGVVYRNEDFRIKISVLKGSRFTDDGHDHKDSVAFTLEDTVWSAERSEFLEG